MKAVLFDVYGTLLIGTRVADRERPLRRLAERFNLRIPEGTSISTELDRRVAVAHQASSERFPEVDIREIWQDLFPELRDPEGFALEAENSVHPVSLVPDANDTLLRLHSRGIKLGIISNAQAYTRTLLRTHLGRAWKCFDADLLTFSYEHRRAKPDPSLFKLVAGRLASGGIAASEVLMVGDSPANDIEPATRLGFQTHLVVPGQLRLP